MALHSPRHVYTIRNARGRPGYRERSPPTPAPKLAPGSREIPYKLASAREKCAGDPLGRPRLCISGVRRRRPAAARDAVRLSAAVCHPDSARQSPYAIIHVAPRITRRRYIGRDSGRPIPRRLVLAAPKPPGRESLNASARGLPTGGCCGRPPEPSTSERENAPNHQRR